MKKIAKRQALILIAIGLLVIAASQIFSHYVDLPDLMLGMTVGLGIGLLLTAVIFGSFKPA